LNQAQSAPGFLIVAAQAETVPHLKIHLIKAFEKLKGLEKNKLVVGLGLSEM